MIPARSLAASVQRTCRRGRGVAVAAALLSLSAGTELAIAHADSSDEPVVAFALEDKPRWEFGVGGGYLSGFDYPASEDPNRRGIALPYFIYRSPVLRVGDGGIGAVAVERPRVRLDLSLGGSLSSSSEGNSARESMPDLDYLFEIGPKLDVQLLDRRSARYGRTVVGWSSKIRGVLVTDFAGLDSAGFVFATGFKLGQREIFNTSVDLISNLEATFATEKLHDYFYEVAPRFETAERAAYDASGGYLGTRLLLALAYRPRPDIRLFAGVQLGQYSDSASDDSPLFESTSSTGFAVGFAWRIFQSGDSVQVLDTD